jgi:hypothetical protein
MTIGQGCSLCVAQKEETGMREGLEVTQLVNADLKLNYGWRKVARRFGTNRTYIDSRPSMVRIMRHTLLS